MVTKEVIKNLLHEIICAIDSLEYEISIKEIEDQIEANTLMEFLSKNVSICQLTSEECDEINEKLKAYLNRARPQIEKYWGIRNSGLCLLASLLIEEFWN